MRAAGTISRSLSSRVGNHPDLFLCGILNSLPMGFYDAAQLVGCARRHGVEVRPVCVNASRWDCSLEACPTSAGGFAVRLGLLMVKGLRNADGARLVAARADMPFASIDDLHRRTGLGVVALERLAEADAYHALKLTRRGAIWAIGALRDAALPLFAAADAREGGIKPEVVEPAPALKPAKTGREVVDDYRALGLSLKEHPISFLRPALARRGVTVSAYLAGVRDGLGPYLAVYLLTVQRWNEAEIGIVMSVAGLAGIIAQTPAGALVDATHAKRLLVTAAALIVTAGSLPLPFLPSFWPVAISQAAVGTAGAVFAPAIAAITLGIVGHAHFARRTGRNEAFNHAGNAFAAAAAGGAAYVWGQSRSSSSWPRWRWRALSACSPCRPTPSITPARVG